MLNNTSLSHHPRPSRLAFSLILALSFSAAPIFQVVHAAEAPQTLCVTVKTKKMQADALALMEKDTANYINNATLAAAIKTYREVIDIAWEAMQQPYCGFGAYGSASAVKSYTKTVTHARTLFLEQAKKTKTVQPATVAPLKSAPVTEQKIVVPVKQPATPSKSSSIPKGLIQGMRSTGVAELQRRLAVHFKTSTDADHVTGFFGPLTRKLIIRFQLEQKINSSETTPGAGLVGPKTTDALNAI